MLRITLASTTNSAPIEMSNEQDNVLADAVKVGTTTFVTDSTIQQQEFNESPYKSSDLVVIDQTIPDFLKKPYAVYSGTWNTSQTGNTVLYTTNIAPFLTSVTQWNKKIQGYNLVRGTACFRVVINANPFQQGKLISTFVPGNANMTHRNLDLCQKTQQPNVELDCRDATSLIKIPYIATSEWYDMVKGITDWGVYTLSVLSPLSVGSGGENNVNYTIFLYFEDFELTAPLIPQSGAPSMKRKARPNRTVVSHSEKEATGMTEGGSISKGLQMGADIASSVASIPMLAPLAEPASWILRGTSKIAAWFGWSKPESDQPARLSSRRLVPNMSNSTGSSNASTLALFHDNAVEIMPDMAGNGMDEMSFDYLKTRKALIRRNGWATTNSPGDVLYSTVIIPRQLTALDTSFIGGAVSYSLTSMPPFAFLARYFYQWRGSIDILIKFAKTDFHSGRLLITFSPLATGAPTTPTIQTSIQSLREIVDIRGKSEVLLKLPYVIGQQYLKYDQSSGLLTVAVLNELRCPETCSQGVDFLIYVSAGEDFELACPGGVSNDGHPAFVPQGGAAVSDQDQTIVAEPIGGYVIPSMSLEPSRTCVGEMFTSIKQLLNRYTPWQSSVVLLADGTTSNFGIYPYYMGMPTNGLIGPVAPTLTSDALSMFSTGFAFYRGSVKILDVCDDYIAKNPKAQISVNSESQGPVYLSSGLSEAIWYNKANPILATGSTDPVAVQISDAGIGMQETRLPYYCRTHMSEVKNVISTTPSGYSDPNCTLFLGTSNGSSDAHKLYRSCSDEFQLAYFLGFAPVLSSYV